ncbi:MAG: ABC transporter permease subunit [Holdemania filiformis]
MVVVLDPTGANSKTAILIGLIAGMAAGMVFSLLHAYASIDLNADQTVSGTALNLLAAGITVYLCQIFFNQQRTPAFIRGITRIDVPVLKDIRFWVRCSSQASDVLSDDHPRLVTRYVVFKTPFGLRMRSCRIRRLRRRWASTSAGCAISACWFPARWQAWLGASWS